MTGFTPGGAVFWGFDTVALAGASDAFGVDDEFVDSAEFGASGASSGALAWTPVPVSVSFAVVEAEVELAVLVSLSLDDAVSVAVASVMVAAGAAVSVSVFTGAVDGEAEVAGDGLLLLAVLPLSAELTGVLAGELAPEFAGLLEGLTLVIIQVAIPIPANTKIATATPAISMPALPFFGAAAAGSAPSSGISRSTNVGRRLRFLPVFGGCDRSLPVEIDRFAALAVGEAISVPASEVGGTPGSGGNMAEAPGPVAIVLSLSGNIFPKSTGDEELTFVHGTCESVHEFAEADPEDEPGADPGAEFEAAPGAPGKTGEIRELELVGEPGGRECIGVPKAPTPTCGP